MYSDFVPFMDVWKSVLVRTGWLRGILYFSLQCLAESGAYNCMCTPPPKAASATAVGTTNEVEAASHGSAAASKEDTMEVIVGTAVVPSRELF